MIDLDNADIYFDGANHPLSAVWFAFTQTQREAAVNAARRQLERDLRRVMKEDYAEDSKCGRRDDYAVYEQALHLLRKTPQSAQSSSPYPVAADNVTGFSYEEANMEWGSAALRWLGWTGATVIRG